jgi:hypothetical protein
MVQEDGMNIRNIIATVVGVVVVVASYQGPGDGQGSGHVGD